MSIDTSAMIVAGLPNRDFEALGIDVAATDWELEHVSPYYDGWEDAIWGICVDDSPGYVASELPPNLAELIEKAKTEFKAITGQDAKVWLTPRIW